MPLAVGYLVSVPYATFPLHFAAIHFQLGDLHRVVTPVLIPWICWLGSIRAAMHREAERGGFTPSQFLTLQASLASPGSAATSHPTEVKFLACQDKQYGVGSVPTYFCVLPDVTRHMLVC